MRDLFEGKAFLTTADVARIGLMSKSKQLEARKKGLLKYTAIGTGKVIYLPHHIADYLALCERGGQETIGENV